MPHIECGVAYKQLPNMQDDSDITVWIDGLRQSDPTSAERIWRHFLKRLLAATRGRIATSTRSRYDEEDAAQSAFLSLCSGMVDGRFPDVDDRNSLWHLLLKITSRKISARHRYDHRQQRSVSRSVQESAIGITGVGKGLDALPSGDPSPEFSSEFKDTCDQLFAGLEGNSLEQVGLLKMEGHTDSEVASKLNCSRRTVQRRLEVIRPNWLELLDAPMSAE